MRTARTLLIALGLWAAPSTGLAAGPMPATESETSEPGTAELPVPLTLPPAELCQAEPVTVYRGKGKASEPTQLALTLCDGRPNPAAARALTVLSRPGSAEPEQAPGDLDPALLIRLQAIASHFEGRALVLVSGYRPKARSSSRHRQGAAVDLRVSGVDNAELRDFARTLEGTGVGYYPNSSFVHIDVRAERYYWVDLSGPGERADYVSDPEAEHPEQEMAAAGTEPGTAVAALAATAPAPAVPEADLVLGLDEVEAYLAEAEVTAAMGTEPGTEPETGTVTATETGTVTATEPGTATATEPGTVAGTVAETATEPGTVAIDLPAPEPAPEPDSVESPVATLAEPALAPAAPVAPVAAPKLASLPDPDAVPSAADTAAARAPETDPELLGLAELGPPTAVELQALAGRAVYAVLAAMPPSTQLDGRLPGR
jgi:hypothetical protein